MASELLTFVKDLFSDCKNGTIETEDEGLVNVKVPELYSELPVLEALEEHTVLDLDKIKKYFQYVKDQEIRIMHINGMQISGWCTGYYCDYCRASCEGSKYYYCYDCHKDMCSLCYGETNKAIAIANGEKNYEKRREKCSSHDINGKTVEFLTGFGVKCFNCKTYFEKGHSCSKCGEHICDSCQGETNSKVKDTFLDNVLEGYKKLNEKVEPCRSHDLVERSAADMFGFSCDVCDEIISGDRYSNAPVVGFDNCSDVCLSCAEEEEEGQQMVKEKDLKKVIKSNVDILDFGSMLDWIPVLEDSDSYDAVFVNLNPASPYHQQVCLMAVDDHGRSGFSTIRKEGVGLDQVVAKVREYQNNSDWKDLEGWNKHYNRPIKQLMNDYNMPTHFG